MPGIVPGTGDAAANKINTALLSRTKGLVHKTGSVVRVPWQHRTAFQGDSKNASGVSLISRCASINDTWR